MLWLVRLRGSPHAIARGVALGILVAFTPTIGVQTLLALGLATLLNANRPAAAAPVWLTNPVTIPPVYAFTYYLGSFFWPGPDRSDVARLMRDAAHELQSLDFLALGARLQLFIDLGIDVFVPLMIGGLLTGGLIAAVAYPLTLRLVIELRGRRIRNRRAPRRVDRP